MNRKEVTDNLDGGFDFMDFGSYGVYVVSLLRLRNYAGHKGHSIIARCVVEHETRKHDQKKKYTKDTEFDIRFAMDGKDDAAKNRNQAEFLRFVRAVKGHATTPKNWDADADVGELMRMGKFPREAEVSFSITKTEGATKEYEAKDENDKVIIVVPEDGSPPYAQMTSITYDRTKYAAI